MTHPLFRKRLVRAFLTTLFIPPYPLIPPIGSRPSFGSEVWGTPFFQLYIRTQKSICQVFFSPHPKLTLWNGPSPALRAETGHCPCIWPSIKSYRLLEGAFLAPPELIVMLWPAPRGRIYAQKDLIDLGYCIGGS